jgi:undecaprenyl-diphosphatase
MGLLFSKQRNHGNLPPDIYKGGYGMEILTAAILGIIQGLTEFLPISSSAHLILIRWFFGWKPEGIEFDVALHVGTAVAVIAFFWKDWICLAREMIAGVIEGSPLGNSHRRLAWFLIIGTIPASVVGLKWDKTIDAQLHTSSIAPLIIGFTLAILGALLLLAEHKSKQNRTIEMFTWADALWIGCSQAVALIPGVSRSGITIATAMLRNSSRTDAARFAFLLSTPVIAGAGILKGWHLIKAMRHPIEGAATVQWAVLCVGFLTAAIVGFLCIKFFLRHIQTKSLAPFVIYRFLLAAVVLIYYFKRH